MLPSDLDAARDTSIHSSDAVHMHEPFINEDDITSQRFTTAQWRDDSDTEEETDIHHVTGNFEGGDMSLARNSGQYQDSALEVESTSLASPTLQFEDTHDLGESIVPVSLEEDGDLAQPNAAHITPDSQLTALVHHENPTTPLTHRDGSFSEKTQQARSQPGMEDPNVHEQLPPPANPMKSTSDDTCHENNRRQSSPNNDNGAPPSPLATYHTPHKGDAVSSWSHQQLAPRADVDDDELKPDEGEWQDMPAFATHDIYDDDGKIIAKELADEIEALPGYSALGGAAKGYTKVDVDEDAKSANSMDDDTAYLFNKERGAAADEFDEDLRDPTAQMQATKDLLTDNQRIAYVGVVRLALAEIVKEVESIERTRGAKKEVDLARDTIKLWAQKMMVRLYAHMELDSAEQLMIEQLTEHALRPDDLTPTLMQNARVKNPMTVAAKKSQSSEDGDGRTSLSLPEYSQTRPSSSSANREDDGNRLPAYEEVDGEDMPGVRTPSQLPTTDKLDIDLRWTVLCDLFLTLISGSTYDARSRALLERVGSFLSVPWLDICRFEKRVTDALEMQQEANKEDWDVDESMEKRRKGNFKKRLVVIGLATVGGGLVIGLSAGLLAPVIGAGLAAGLTTIGVTGTGTFLGGAAGAAVIGTGAAGIGGAIGAKAGRRRTGAVKEFEFRPLHNNKRVNLIVTVAGWMTGKVDDVRLPYSTVDPIMGDLYSIHWEPEMLRSMGDTINILATEALTQGLQQILGSTILIGLMAAIQLPMVLSKLAYLIDNPWSNSLARADLAGLILADSLVERSLGSRPITLVGFSLGSRLIFSCLRELSKRGAVGLIQNVYLFGSPVIANKDEYLKVRTIVSGRFVNGYATNDWILGYLFRATSGGLARVAGLAEVRVPGIENLNVTKLVPGHMSYRTAMPKLLREVGWAITSDEFEEIEDPDPDNHEKRQRELINEIEEARKELQEKPQKGKFFGLFKGKKAKKKEWETYEDSLKNKQVTDQDATEESSATGSVMFDIDSISREVAGIAAQGIQLKEHKPTMPPLRLSPTPSPNGSARSSAEVFGSRARPFSNSSKPSGATTTPPAAGATSQRQSSHQPHPKTTYDYEYDPSDHDDHHLASEAAITMTFGTPVAYRTTTAATTSQRQPSSSETPTRTRKGNTTTRFPIANANPISKPTSHDYYSGDLGDFSNQHQADVEENISLSFDIQPERRLDAEHTNGNGFEPPEPSTSSPPINGRPVRSGRGAAASTLDNGGARAYDEEDDDIASVRAIPQRSSASLARDSKDSGGGSGKSMPRIEKNVWADEDDDLGKEKEMEMTFE